MGQLWLKEVRDGRFFKNHYIAHTQLENGRMVAILSYETLLIVRLDTMKMEHNIMLDKIKECTTVDDNKLAIHFKKKTTRLLNISEKTSCDWFYSKIMETLSEKNDDS